MDQIDRLRAAFPGYPSELDAAKVASHWASLAQAFFCAARVLDEEATSAHKEMRARDGKVVKASNVMRAETGLPAEFCLAFSLELAIKSALVAQGNLHDMTSGEALPFGNHRLLGLAQEVDGLTIGPGEKKTLKWASEAVLSGKYPVPKKPSDAKRAGPVFRPFSALFGKVEPLYKRLTDMSKSDESSEEGTPS